jgi:hypothetical protein
MWSAASAVVEGGFAAHEADVHPIGLLEQVPNLPNFGFEEIRLLFAILVSLNLPVHTLQAFRDKFQHVSFQGSQMIGGRPRI